MASGTSRATSVVTHKLIKGSGSVLAQAIKNKHYPRGWESHPWADERVLVNGQKGLEAHHIITTFNLKGKNWVKYRKAYEYDINTWENGIMLPSSTDIACQVKTHVHRSHHQGGLDFIELKDAYWEKDTVEDGSELYNPSSEVPQDDIDKIKSGGYLTYIKGIDKKLALIVKRAEKNYYCKPGNKALFSKHMNAQSKVVLKLLDSFLFTISTFGHDYSPVSKVGCANDSVESKSKNRDFCRCDRNHSLKNNGSLMKYRRLEVGK